MSHSGCEMGSFVRKGEKVTTAKQTENSRHPSQNLAPERECTRVPLGDEKCFPWAVHHHHPPQRQLPHLGHISPEGRGWALGMQCCPGFFGQPLVIDGLGLHASPGRSCCVAERRGGREPSILSEQQRSAREDSRSRWKCCWSPLFHCELLEGRISFPILFSLGSDTSPPHIWLSVNVEQVYVSESWHGEFFPLLSVLKSEPLRSRSVLIHRPVQTLDVKVGKLRTREG